MSESTQSLLWQPPKPEDEIANIKVALKALLAEMLRRDRKPREYRVGSAMTMAEIDRWHALGKNFRAADAIIKDPVRTACRDAIRKLGKRLHELVGDDHDGMLKVANSVSGQKHYSHHISIIDKAWDGIGDWHS
jgi:hypothetical protein